jgi:hypothetical protein
MGILDDEYDGQGGSYIIGKDGKRRPAEAAETPQTAEPAPAAAPSETVVNPDSPNPESEAQ